MDSYDGVSCSGQGRQHPIIFTLKTFRIAFKTFDPVDLVAFYSQIIGQSIDQTMKAIETMP